MVVLLVCFFHKTSHSPCDFILRNLDRFLLYRAFLAVNLEWSARRSENGKLEDESQ
jgi:hypothetical protein